MATTVEQVTYNSPDGATMGRVSTEKISFYGVTPIVRSTISSEISTTAFISTAGIYGFASSTEALQVTRAISTIAARLIEIGLFVED
jgi:hypothetical protein